MQAASVRQTAVQPGTQAVDLDKLLVHTERPRGTECADSQQRSPVAPCSKRSELLGELLLNGGFVTPDQLEVAIARQRESGQRLGQVLLDMGFTTADAVLGALSLQLGIAAVRLNGHTIQRDAVAALPERVARQHLAFPLLKVGRTLKVAIATPKDLNALDDLRFASGCRIETVIALEDEIHEAFNRYYCEGGGVPDAEPEADLIIVETPLVDRRDPTRHLERRGVFGRRVTDLAPVEGAVHDSDTERSAVRVVDRVLLRAIGERASDVHFEPMEETLRVRCRIDGVFRDIAFLSSSLAPAIIARIKVLAGMDITEHRVPQDGRFSVINDARPLDLRASTFPVVYGEKIVLRLLDHGRELLRLDGMGMNENVLARFRDLMHRPQGLILVTGPTGSGKSSTLYAALAELAETGRNIVTIEDPVEFALPGVNQGQTNDKAGFTFAKGLRAILRQDPDVIMVGEIRDTETLMTAIEASLTGHLVLTTLHTNSATATIARLTEMELEPYLVAASVQCIVAQRLVRQICRHCREAFPLPGGVSHLFPTDPPEVLYRGRGCRECRGTGYRGRTGLFEMMQVTDEVRGLLLAGSPESELLHVARRNGMITLREACLASVRNGNTTLEELVRITQAP